MKQNQLAVFPLLWAASFVQGDSDVAWSGTFRRALAASQNSSTRKASGQDHLGLPRLPKGRSNATTAAAKVNVTFPLVAHQGDKAVASRKQEPMEPSEDVLDPENIGAKVKGCQTPICMSKADIIVLVDVSGGVGEAGIKKVKAAMKKFPYHFYPPPEDWSEGQFLALMSYGKGARFHVQWTGDKEEFQEAADGIKLYWGSGDLAAGLTKAQQLFLYGRSDSFHNVLVITDGGSTYKDQANQAAANLANSGATLFVMVIEEFVGPVHDELFEVITHTGQVPANSYLMSVDSYNDLDSDHTIANMVYALCPQTANLLQMPDGHRRVAGGNHTGRFRKAQNEDKKLDNSAT